MRKNETQSSEKSISLNFEARRLNELINDLDFAETMYVFVQRRIGIAQRKLTNAHSLWRERESLFGLAFTEIENATMTQK